MDGYLASEMNLWKLAAENKDRMPKLYFACGTKDPIAYKNYLKFQDYAKEIGLEAEFRTEEGYSHEWAFWDLCIQEAVEKFFG
jgi:putative tributyrin esterase